MAEITFISTTAVRSSTHVNDPTDHKIDLTPWDLQLLLVGPIQKGLLFRKPKPNMTNIIDHLKISLSLTLDFFPPLPGRLAATNHPDTTTPAASFSIHCNNSGAQFVHAVAKNVAVSDILTPVFVPSFLRSFFPLNGVRNCDGVSKPLVAVQVTELSDGFFVGCTVNHVVADGSSFWHFFKSWSEISRGDLNRIISRPHFLQRWVPDNINFPIHIPTDEIETDHVVFTPPPHLQERVFHFTKEKISKLKAKANAEIGTTKISSLQALLAHLWRSVVRCEHIDPHQQIKYKLLIGARPRLQPPLPETYFGNAVHFETVTTTAGELLRNGLGWAAWEMNRKIASQTDGGGIKRFLEGWVENPKVAKMGEVTRDALITSSSPRFDVYGCDFGWGKPVAVRSGGGNKHDGKITVFPGAEQDGSIDVEVCLVAETLEAMVDDDEFMDALV